MKRMRPGEGVRLADTFLLQDIMDYVAGAFAVANWANGRKF